MNANESAGLILGLAGALVGFSLLVVPVLVRWRQLVRRYPDRAFAAVHTFNGLSGTVTGSLFRTMLRLALDGDGVRLSTPWPFRLLLPAFVVPWSAITSCRREPFAVSPNALRIDIVGVDEPIHLRGFLWHHGDALPTIVDYWHGRHSTVA